MTVTVPEPLQAVSLPDEVDDTSTCTVRIRRRKNQSVLLSTVPFAFRACVMQGQHRGFAIKQFGISK
jgi:hypothetical protein